MKSERDWFRLFNIAHNPHKGMNKSEFRILETMRRYVKERSVIFPIYVMSIYV